ncbi:hypothetical protein Vafri_21749 [Volvox africanus]|uniref:Uncharacterized protein n=1 Tax=Volvox africanus TaxID=51714 RepID=A0A8J4FE93_9CHLO|nr:hypothetical protein Vafri_21749 [Volvox africanus]
MPTASAAIFPPTFAAATSVSPGAFPTTAGTAELTMVIAPASNMLPLSSFAYPLLLTTTLPLSLSLPFHVLGSVARLLLLPIPVRLGASVGPTSPCLLLPPSPFHILVLFPCSIPAVHFPASALRISRPISISFGAITATTIPIILNCRLHLLNRTTPLVILPVLSAARPHAASCVRVPVLIIVFIVATL